MKVFSSLFSLAIASVALISCGSDDAKTIKVGEQCEHCKMSIENVKYATELITEKGKIYKFDDIKCMNGYANSNADKVVNAKTYVTDYPSGKLIEFEKATFIKGGSIKSPMGGNMQAYENKEEAEKAKKEFGVE
ncbi:MAG: nitrous oxide reductase accessory protein NosL [Bacteroidetes bacterium]|nr:nitrous oxide reductase accessory protein NosL [Bacteroidota bacterium]